MTTRSREPAGPTPEAPAEPTPEAPTKRTLQDAAAESTDTDRAERLQELRNTLIPLKRKELQLLEAEERFLRLFQAIGPVSEKESV